MVSPVLQVLLSLGMVLVIVLLSLDIHGWVTGARLVNRKQKVLRVTSGAFILMILAMILIGDGPARAHHPLAAVAWWTGCFTLAVAVVLMALADMKQVALHFGEERKQSFDELAGRGDTETRGRGDLSDDG